MCDTVIATGTATADGVTIFGKNSDREPNEAHCLITIPAADHAAGSDVQCTYVAIPQVAHTYGLLLAKPFWIWGAEMGVNEHNVVIGNEAVFTKMPYEKGNALIGMDFLRLGLERGATAREALHVITDLLETHGQGGNCGFQHKLFYHNSYIIADPQEAWVLETAASQWAAKRIEGVYTISNGITITTSWDLASDGLVQTAVSNGWCKNRDNFSFADCYSDFLYTRFSNCHHRCARTRHILEANMGKINVQTIMTALRNHGDAEQDFRPDKGITGSEVCMHAGFGPVRGSQTTGSMVSHLHPKHPTHFVTATAAPCTSIFKPVWLDANLPNLGTPTGINDKTSLFWRHELLHRETLRDYATRHSLYKAERNQLETEFIQGAFRCTADSAAKRTQFSADCFAQADAALEKWQHRVSETAVIHPNRFLYKSAWKKFNKNASRH